MPEPELLTQVRVVPGRIWLMGKEYQDREWDILRDKFHREVVAKGYRLISDPIETTQFDEKLRQVVLDITAEAQRVANVFFAPLGADPTDRSQWKPLGWTDSVTFRP